MTTLHEEVNGVKNMVAVVQGAIGLVLADLMARAEKSVYELGIRLERIEDRQNTQTLLLEQQSDWPSSRASSCAPTCGKIYPTCRR